MQALDELDLELRSCTVCGCTDQVPCPGGCGWTTATLCTRCRRAIEEDRPLLLDRPVPRRVA